MNALRVAVLRCERLPRFLTWEIPDVEALFADDRLLVEAFAARGVEAVPVAWTDDGVDWNGFDGAVIRSTWDYVDDLAHFLEVIDAIERSRCRLLNPADAVRWNTDKRYLDDLDDLGVAVVPLLRGDARDAPRLRERIEQAGWGELVLKPAVGAGGSGVVRADAAGLERALAGFPPGTDVLVQPFARSVLDEGEWSYIFIGGRPSHVLRKRPAVGDFRAHGIYGGTIAPARPDPSDARAVTAMLARLPFDLDYARVDVVRFGGRPAVLELELIEPMLYLDLAPGSADRLADATLRRLRRA
ncbi:ATP-grasp domain-containing protein [Agromyces sp. Marseille-Q5079]|uniref:ATP-grasp domain-containing protein n=1 Tax=Agromyces sp. Marseille-Q5079 TaxID=3439059 RepID=UPI003D9C9406